MTATDLREALQRKKNPDKALHLQRFFKTGPGEYGEGDVFWGLPVPETRSIAALFRQMPLDEIELLLIDPVHEVRMAGGMLLVDKVKKNTPEVRRACYEFYVANAPRFNNWDLVDLTCPQVVGGYLMENDRSILYTLAQSKNLWEQRIAIVSTLFLIKKDDFNETFGVAKLLLHHKHDLIHKAVGWMLREVGKRNHLAEVEFLVESDRYKTMPRTMLRYAIERFPEGQRQAFLKGTI
jgi:3-methyladenine DNA glycosylase AlkD